MRGKRAIHYALGREEPALAVRLHNEGIAASDGVHAGCAWRRCIIRGFVQLEVRHVYAGPLLLLLVPPDVLLAFRPGATLRISRGAIVQDAPVGGPGKAPLQERIPLWITRGGTVIARLWVDPAVNPRAAGRTAVIVERCEPCHV